MGNKVRKCKFRLVLSLWQVYDVPAPNPVLLYRLTLFIYISYTERFNKKCAGKNTTFPIIYRLD